MCYSAEVQADYRQYVKSYGATLSIEEFYDLFWRRARGEALDVPRAIERWFDGAVEGCELQVREAIQAYNDLRATQLQQKIFEQRARLADAERKLATKPTKTAAEEQRKATNNIERAREKLADLTRTVVEPRRDARIFPKHYAPVIIMREGKRVIVPMRYQCRPAGRPATYDELYPGTYNARRNNLEKFWRNDFGKSHGVIIVTRFYENVKRHVSEHRELRAGEREENLVLEFNPSPQQEMVIACLWSHHPAPEGAGLNTFAAITDEPPPEVWEAGHDRCIVQIRPENIDAWLKAEGSLQDMYDILDDRPRPYYEHRLAA